MAKFDHSYKGPIVEPVDPLPETMALITFAPAQIDIAQRMSGVELVGIATQTGDLLA